VLELPNVTRRAVRALWLVPSVVAGCAQLSGLDQLTVCDGASCVDAQADAYVLDAPTDVAAQPDVAADADAGALPDAGPGKVCVAPADCFAGSADTAYPPDSGQVCCGTFVMTGSAPKCTLLSQSSECTTPAKCPTSAVLACSTEVLRRCAFPQECVEQGYDKCCTIKLGDASVQACANLTIAQATGGTCP
jgi:hypothetical protein